MSCLSIVLEKLAKFFRGYFLGSPVMLRFTMCSVRTSIRRGGWYFVAYSFSYVDDAKHYQSNYWENENSV